MNHVRGWVQQRLHTLQSLLPQPFVETDFTDDLKRIEVPTLIEPPYFASN